jgi:hypothetical protein
MIWKMRLHLLKTTLVMLMIDFLTNACLQAKTKEEGAQTKILIYWRNQISE